MTPVLDYDWKIRRQEGKVRRLNRFNSFCLTSNIMFDCYVHTKIYYVCVCLFVPFQETIKLIIESQKWYAYHPFTAGIDLRAVTTLLYLLPSDIIRVAAWQQWRIRNFVNVQNYKFQPSLQPSAISFSLPSLAFLSWYIKLKNVANEFGAESISCT